MNKAQQHRSDCLYEQHLIHLTLQGKRPATIDAYSHALRRITHQLDKSPDTLTTDDLKRYFTQLFKTHSWSTVKIDRNRLQFFFKHVLQRDWKWLLQQVLPLPGNRLLNNKDNGFHASELKRWLGLVQHFE